MSTGNWPNRNGPSGQVIAGRYRLGVKLGHGAFGEVWDAEDFVLGERVALKRILQKGPESPQIRREIATLRQLRIPGVVRLVDEGEEDGCPFFVMERITGAPFPGLRTAMLDGNAETIDPLGSTVRKEPPALSVTMGSSVESHSSITAPPDVARESTQWDWSSMAAVTEALLETLRRVHAAGIVHRDLKPANVLVRPDGRPVLVDFGLCLPTAEGARLPERGSKIQGTPAYLAPEQIRGGPIDARADLYAVGVMLYEALTACMPHDATTIAGLFLVRATQRAVPVRHRVASIPPKVADLVDRLLAPSPMDRPQSAQDVLEVLRSNGHKGLQSTPTIASARVFHLPEGDGPFEEVELRKLFSGRDRLFHLRQDAARVLRERTDGMPSRIKDELAAWIDAGLARWDGDVLVVDRDALDRFEAGFPMTFATRRHLALVAAGEDTLAATEALSRARILAEQGRLGLASAVLAEGLASVRRAPAPNSSNKEVETALLAEWVKVALAEQRSQALDRVLYEVCRSRLRSVPEVARMEGLLRAAISVRTFFSSESAALAAELGAFDDPTLERWRHWLRIRAWMYVDMAQAERFLEEATAWAERGDAAARAATAGFHGMVAFVKGHFPEAARWHAVAAAEEAWLTLRIAQMLNEAVAFLEAFEPERAQEVAQGAAKLAAQCRHPHFEGRAAWTARDAAHRAGVPMVPDFEFIEALADLGTPDTLGAACLTEAAIAFRYGDRASAADLASRATDTWQRAGQRYPAMLARTLAVSMGAALAEGEADSLATLAAQCPVPGIGIQALALLTWACPTLPLPPLEVIESLCAQVSEARWQNRIDVLSVDEARSAILGATQLS